MLDKHDLLRYLRTKTELSGPFNQNLESDLETNEYLLSLVEADMISKMEDYIDDKLSNS